MSIGKKLFDAAALADETESLNTIQELLEWATGGDVNWQDGDGKTVLMQACEKGHTQVVEMLLSRPDILVNVKGKYGATALIDACWRGHTRVLRILLAHHDTDINAQNTMNGSTALMMASVRGNIMRVQMLLAHPGINVNLQDQVRRNGTILSVPDQIL
mmetsp:Transcript_15847/g.27886  ORF Transcript_15847/g.27886 Transcript_15847/m.27886 type:complete len:159 (+) Transcript_15847:100-576(+)